MKQNDFKDYGSTAKLLNYKTIPFSKVAVLEFTQEWSVVKFKTSHDPLEPMQYANIRFPETPLRRKKNMNTSPGSSGVTVFDVKPKIQKYVPEISELKKKDIKSSFPFMPLQDREYYKVVLHIM